MAAPQERDWRESVLRSGEDSDVTVCVEGRDFHLHSLILRQRSPFFKVQLAPSTSWREAQTGRVQIQEASQKIFGILLPFIYSHRLVWNNADWTETGRRLLLRQAPPPQPETFQDVLDLLKLAEFLQLADFAEYLLASHRKELENMLDGELKTVLPIFAGGERTGIGYREQALADSIGAIEGFVKAALEAYSDHIPFFKELLDQRLAAYARYWPLLLALLLLAEDYGLAKLSKSAMDILLGRGEFIATSDNFNKIFSEANVRFASEKWGGKRVVRAAWDAFNRLIPRTDPGFPGARATMGRVVAHCTSIHWYSFDQESDWRVRDLAAQALGSVGEHANDAVPAAKRSRIAEMQEAFYGEADIDDIDWMDIDIFKEVD